MKLHVTLFYTTLRMIITRKPIWFGSRFQTLHSITYTSTDINVLLVAIPIKEHLRHSGCQCTFHDDKVAACRMEHRCSRNGSIFTLTRTYSTHTYIPLLFCLTKILFTTVKPRTVSWHNLLLARIPKSNFEPSMDYHHLDW